MIALTLLTQPDCGPCSHGRAVLAELSGEFPLTVREVDLHSEEGRRLAAEHRLMFAPGLIADGKLIAHGRLSQRALRRDLTRLIPAPTT
ncbi:MAG: glutaredoxin family protein [Candidatus Methylomirabilales bacterium]